MVKQAQQKKGFVITYGYLFLFLIIFAIMLAGAFGMGVYMGKERLIQAETKAIRQSEIQPPIMTKNIAESNPQEVPATNNPRQENINNEPQTTASNLPKTITTVPVPNQSQESIRPEYTVIPQYTVQVGVFGSRENAEKLAKILNSYEYDSWILSKTNNEKTLHFVFNGRFGTKEEAERAGKLMQERITYIKEYKVKEIER